MNTIAKRLPSPAMLVACVALVVALGGVSYAASVLPKNSVGTAQLQKKAVTGGKLKKNAVTTPQVKDGTLLAADFKAGQLPAGSQGPKGDTGPTGPKGDKGDPGATHVVERHGSGPAAGPGAYSTAYVECQAGETVVGGGGGVSVNGAGKQTLTATVPVTYPQGWSATYRNDGAGGTVQAGVYALCASP
jgi:hypothetical protein